MGAVGVVRTVKRFVPANVKDQAKTSIARVVPVRTAEVINANPHQCRAAIAAMSRSGHHAVTNWLVNAIEGKPVDFTRYAGTYSLHIWERSAFINNLNCARVDYKHVEIRRFASPLQAAPWLMTNYEDIELTALDSMPYRFARPDHRIYIRRPLVDLTASRLKARQSWASGDDRMVPVDRRFIDTVLANEQQLDGWLVIDYDRWLTNADGHRKQVLDALGLTFDQMPGVSPYGQGSSFTGTQRVPTAEELLNRHRQIDWPADVVELLLEPQYRRLLRPSDVDFLMEVRGS